MISRMKPMDLLGVLVVVCAAVLITSCGPKVRKPLVQLDTPGHHAFTGIRLLDQKKVLEAGREFKLALRLDPGYPRAHVGIALVQAHERDFAGALEALRRAGMRAYTDEEKIFLQIGTIRVNTMSRSECMRIGTECSPDDGWLKNSKAAFDQVMMIDPKSADAHYFMGEAYLTALDLNRAGRMFGWVPQLGGEHVREAEARLNLVQKIQRAMPGTMTGKKIALAEQITRADVAALLIEELKLELLFAGRGTKGPGTAFRDPHPAAKVSGGRHATDIDGHPLRAEIEAMVKTGIRGLGLYPDGRFRPDLPVDRATYAMLIEEILIRCSGDPALSKRFIGTPSPFPDLWEGLPYFNAVMVVTSRGLMESKDRVSGAFLPLEPIGGADALLVIRKMREALRY